MNPFLNFRSFFGYMFFPQSSFPYVSPQRMITKHKGRYTKKYADGRQKRKNK